MDKTSNLQLPYIASNQAQKHVTHNDALRSLDAIVQLSVVSQSQTAPPSSLNEGDRFIVEKNATDEWLGKDHEIAAWQDGAWMFYTPQKGWLCWVEDENVLFVWDGNDWGSAGSGGTTSTNPTSLVGVNATGDLTNRLSVNSPATLLNHEGNSHQLKINKNTISDTASTLFQTGFSGRAEFGLTGDDDFHMKVSPDGSTFHEGIIIDKDNGAVSFPKGIQSVGNSQVSGFRNLIINGAFDIWQRGTAATHATTGQFLADRFKTYALGTNIVTQERSSDVPNSSFSYSLKLSVTSVDPSAERTTRQTIEDGKYYLNVPLTFSCWVKGPNGATAYFGPQDLNDPVQFTGNWQKIEITKTVLSAGGLGEIWLDTLRGYNQTGDYFITGAQLEVGEIASYFERKLSAIELSLCQRYFQKSYDLDVYLNINTFVGSHTSFATNPWTLQQSMISFKQTMRDTPTVILYSPQTGNSGVSFGPVEGVDVSALPTWNSQNGFEINGNANFITGNYYRSHWSADAEI